MPDKFSLQRERFNGKRRIKQKPTHRARLPILYICDNSTKNGPSYLPRFSLGLTSLIYSTKVNKYEAKRVISKHFQKRLLRVLAVFRKNPVQAAVHLHGADNTQSWMSWWRSNILCLWQLDFHQLDPSQDDEAPLRQCLDDWFPLHPLTNGGYSIKRRTIHFLSPGGADLIML